MEEEGDDKVVGVLRMHGFNGMFHEHRLAGARVPFYPEKSP